MNTQNTPQIGDIFFLTQRRVMVMKVYLLFRLVSVRYLNEVREFCVDIGALSNEPDYTNSISLRFVKGSYSE